MQQEVAKSRKPTTERRRRRSSEPLTALQYQLDHISQQMPCDVLVLASERGETAASIGRRELVERVSVQSPFLVDRSKEEVDETLSFLWDIYPNLTSRSMVAKPIPVEFLQERFILIGVGESMELQSWLDHAARGVNRILKEAAAA